MNRIAMIGMVLLILVGCSRETASLEPVDSLTAEELAGKFRENEVRADQAYRGKVVDVTGTIRGMRMGPLGGVHVDVGTPTHRVSATFPKSQQAAVAAKNKGDMISFRGKCDGMVLGSVSITDAVFEN